MAMASISAAAVLQALSSPLPLPHSPRRHRPGTICCRNTSAAHRAPKQSWIADVRGGGNFIDPEWLDSSLPGDYGFDPQGLGKDPAFLKWYREAELFHGRSAMAVVVGILVGQAWSGVPWFEAGADPAAITPFSFGTQLILMGWVE